MAVEARFVGGVDDYPKGTLTAGAALEPGDVLQYHDGRAAVVAGSDDVASGDPLTVALGGLFEALITDSIGGIAGQPLWWDESANKLHVKYTGAGDFYVGTLAADVTAGTSVKAKFWLNARPHYVWGCGQLPGLVDGSEGVTIQEIDTAGTAAVRVLPGGAVALTLSATSEAQCASFMSDAAIPVTDKWALDVLFEIVDNGDNAALDIDIGVANDDHATDFETIGEFVALHLDGNDLDLDAHSDDGTTDTALTDTTVNVVEGTPIVACFDGRDQDNLDIWVDGAEVLSGTTFTLGAATGPIRAIAQIEKTANDTTAEVRILYMGLRRVDDGGAA